MTHQPDSDLHQSGSDLSDREEQQRVERFLAWRHGLDRRRRAANRRRPLSRRRPFLAVGTILGIAAGALALTVARPPLDLRSSRASWPTASSPRDVAASPESRPSASTIPAASASVDPAPGSQPFEVAASPRDAEPGATASPPTDRVSAEERRRSTAHGPGRRAAAHGPEHPRSPDTARATATAVFTALVAISGRSAGLPGSGRREKRPLLT
jgi:hypothetical protein